MYDVHGVQMSLSDAMMYLSELVVSLFHLDCISHVVHNLHQNMSRERRVKHGRK